MKAAGGAVAVALITAAVVLVMVNFGGGVTRPLTASPHASAASQTSHG